MDENFRQQEKNFPTAHNLKGHLPPCQHPLLPRDAAVATARITWRAHSASPTFPDAEFSALDRGDPFRISRESFTCPKTSL